MNCEYDPLLLKNQLCFPLYACAKEVVKRYRPFLDALDLTYTQYITMLVLWEQPHISAKEIGGRLFLDSGTLTPVLKSLAAKGYLTRQRSTEDERVLIIELTEKGRALRERALEIPSQMRKCIPIEDDDISTLYRLLYKLLDSAEPEE